MTADDDWHDPMPAPMQTRRLLWLMAGVYICVNLIWLWVTFTAGKDVWAFVNGIMFGVIDAWFVISLLIVWYKSR